MEKWWIILIMGDHPSEAHRREKVQVKDLKNIG